MQVHRKYWIAGALFIVVVFALAILAVIPPKNKMLFWFQAFVIGRTNESSRALLIPPPANYTGKWYTYHSNLTVDSEMDYVNGKVRGTWTRHDKETGHIWWVGEYKDNCRVGIWRRYSRATGVFIGEEKGDGEYEPIGEQDFMLFWLEWNRYLLYRLLPPW